MKIQLRQGVFESNSSSQHSICIKKENEYYTEDEILEGIWLKEDGSWDLYEYDLKFGRSPFKCLYSFSDKFYYCMSALCGEYKDDIWNELEEIAKECIPGLKAIFPAMGQDSKRIFKEENTDYGYGKGYTEEEMEKFLDEKSEQFGMDLKYWEASHKDYWHYDYPYTGYAEDYGMLKEFLNKTGLLLKEFLTNKKYVIIVDGDEYCIWGILKASNLVNTEKIESEYNLS